ncbi:MAG: hypothetical protein HQK63_01905 [Desulfamplus sp.]|nr:hypothetical protein [Desulfamplus sp.]
MEMTITLPNDFKNLPETDRVKIILSEIENSEKQNIFQYPKWVGIANKMRKKKLLSGTSDYILRQSEEFREHFSFRHDNE